MDRQGRGDARGGVAPGRRYGAHRIIEVATEHRQTRFGYPPSRVNLLVMPLRYVTGEEIREGDRILYDYDRLPGQVELVADPEVLGDEDWYVRKYGGGVLLTELSVFGTLFLRAKSIDERLVFASRKGE